MANTGDNYTITLDEAHLDWGIHRNTNSRRRVEGEAYLPIPIPLSKRFDVVNSNGTGGLDIRGRNIFRFSTKDGFLTGTLKAQGSSKAKEIYAKQFSVRSDLQTLGTWYDHIDAEPGTQIHVEWISPEEIRLTAL